ncbi:MAG: response regulator [Actinomycetia bacterium]|nr:response regulator [Actinomycetes bacterium]MCP4084595.1 response regulator [Actinomycetes bacterium]
MIIDPNRDLGLRTARVAEQTQFRALVETDGLLGLGRVVEDRPDLVTLALDLEGLNGFELCKAIRADARLSSTAIIFVTDHDDHESRIRALDLGADDYVVHPFNPGELAARMRSALRRTQQLRSVSPLTGLPGNVEIVDAVKSLIDDEMPFALVHADLDHFKAFNDHYGFLRGDRILTETASAVVDSLVTVTGVPRFAGHIGGDDFALIVPPDEVEAVCGHVIETFDAIVPSFYDDVDRDRGWVEVADRQGVVRRHRLLSISLGVASTATRSIESPAEASVIAGHLKEFAKAVEGSAWRVDQRRD